MSSELEKRFSGYIEGKNEFLSVTGSYPKKGEDANDLDMLYISNQEIDLPDEIKGKELDEWSFKLEEAMKRIENNDYELASLLEKSKFICGDEEYYKNAKELIFEGIDQESIDFNKKKALEYKDHANICMKISRYASRNDIDLSFSIPKIKQVVFEDSFCTPLEGRSKKNFKKAIGNYAFSLGYKISSNLMEEENRLKTFEEIENPLFESFIEDVKHLKYLDEIDCDTVNRYFESLQKVENEIRKI